MATVGIPREVSLDGIACSCELTFRLCPEETISLGVGRVLLRGHRDARRLPGPRGDPKQVAVCFWVTQLGQSWL
jgi:hypothetical protein